MTGTPSKLSDDNEFHWTPDGIRRVEETRRAAGPPSAHPAKAEAPTSTDHRRYPRIDLKVPILYRVLHEEPAVASAGLHPMLPTQIDNISVTGAGLVLAERLPPGTMLSLSLHLEDRKKISAVAKVVWSQPTDTPHHHLTGLDFIVVYRKVQSRTEYLNPSTLQDLLG